MSNPFAMLRPAAPLPRDPSMLSARQQRHAAADGEESSRMHYLRNVSQDPIDPRCVSHFPFDHHRVVSLQPDVPGILVRLQANESLCFVGRVLVYVVVGRVVVGGALLQNEPVRFTPCYSATSHALLTLHALPVLLGQSALAEPSRRVPERVRDFCQQHEPEAAAVLWLVPLTSAFDDGLDDLAVQFPRYDVFGARQLLRHPECLETQWCNGFYPIRSPPPGLSPLLVPEYWYALAEELAASCDAPVVAVCGERKAGKSTFARFLLHSLLLRHPKVAFLDGDLGQPEFTTPGMLSLTLVDEPALGPPFTHLRKPERCFYSGEHSAESDPLLYAKQVHRLVAHYRETMLADGIPLVINTNGWVQGLGLEMLMHVLTVSQPTHVVQLARAPGGSSGLPSLHELLANGGTGWREFLREEDSLGSGGDEQWTMGKPGASLPKVMTIPSADQDPALLRPTLDAQDQRHLRVLSYFALEKDAMLPQREPSTIAGIPTTRSLSRWNFKQPLTAKIPISITYDNVQVVFLHHPVVKRLELAAINGCLVGLGRRSGRGGKGMDADDPSEFECVGLGLVRAVDPASATLYLLTPLSTEFLNTCQITALLRGRQEAFASLLFQDPALPRRGPIPYREETSNAQDSLVVLGEMTRKVRHNILRRGQQQ